MSTYELKDVRHAHVALDCYLVTHLHCCCSLGKFPDTLIPLNTKLQHIMQLVLKEAPKSDVVRPLFGVIAQCKEAAVCLLREVLQVDITTSFKGLDIPVFACVFH